MSKIEYELTETEVEDRESFINFALNCDVFSFGYCGYWAYGGRLLQGEPAAWLVYEAVDGRPTDVECELARIAHERGEPLPSGWHLLNREVAERAFAIGCEKWGRDWLDGDHGDGLGYDVDVVMQLALLGEVRYG